MKKAKCPYRKCEVRKAKCPFCGELLTVQPCENGGFTLCCTCAFQCPKRRTKVAAGRDAPTVVAMNILAGGVK